MGTSRISQIAEKAGVSTATVSRVINNSPNVSPATRNRVIAVIKELNYSPNALGRYLRSAKSNTILVAIPRLSNPFFSKVVEGVQDVSAENNYNVMLSHTHSNPALIKKAFDMLAQSQVDGIISLDHFPDDSIFESISRTTPFVQCSEFNASFQNLSYVGIDDEKVSMEVVKYLYSQGRRKIAFFNYLPIYRYARKRETGVRNFFASNNLPVNESFFVHLPTIDFNLAHSAAIDLFSSNSDKPDAVFCVSDILAAAVIKAAKICRLRVPEDVSVVGFDNTNIAAMMDPSITSVNQPRYQMGAQACRILLQKIADPLTPPQHVIMETSLILRQSS